MKTEKESLLTQIGIAMSCFRDAVDLKDFESAHMLSERMVKLTRDLCLIDRQDSEEKAT